MFMTSIVKAWSGRVRIVRTVVDSIPNNQNVNISRRNITDLEIIGNGASNVNLLKPVQIPFLARLPANIAVQKILPPKDFNWHTLSTVNSKALSKTIADPIYRRL